MSKIAKNYYFITFRKKMMTLRKKRPKIFTDSIFLIDSVENNNVLDKKRTKSENVNELNEFVDVSKQVISVVTDQNLNTLEIKEPKMQNFEDSTNSKFLSDLTRGEKISDLNFDTSLVAPKVVKNHIDTNTQIKNDPDSLCMTYDQNLIKKRPQKLENKKNTYKRKKNILDL